MASVWSDDLVHRTKLALAENAALRGAEEGVLGYAALEQLVRCVGGPELGPLLELPANEHSTSAQSAEGLTGKMSAQLDGPGLSSMSRTHLAPAPRGSFTFPFPSPRGRAGRLESTIALVRELGGAQGRHEAMLGRLLLCTRRQCPSLITEERVR